MATVCFYAPDPIQSCQLIPGGNTPANGGQLFFYAAGSSTKQTAYKDNAAAVAWSNPIVLDSGGNLPLGGEVWFPTGKIFKVIFAPANDTDPPASPYWTKDNLSGINDVSTSVSDWVSGPTPTFVSATQFTVAGDQRSIFTAGRRIKTTNTGGTAYSYVINSTFAVLTTVNVVNDSTTLDAGLSAVFYSLIDPALPSINDYYIDRMAASVSSAGNGTTNIWGTNGNSLHIVGTNTIFSFSTAPYAGARRDLIFDGALTLTHNASVIALPGLANIVTQAGDRALVLASTASAALIMQYQRNLNPTIPPGRLINITSFPVPGVSVWNKNASTNSIVVEVSGGGGGGGGSQVTNVTSVAAGGGGGGGGWAQLFVAAPASTVSVTTGANGIGVNNANGTNGSTSQFGALVSCGGGVGGLVGGNIAFGGAFGSAGGSASGGDINVIGFYGLSGVSSFSGNYVNAGKGADHLRGSGGFRNGAGAGSSAAGFGAGGSGAASASTDPARTGGDGARGLVMVYEYA